jgi:hypothetical protein
MQGAAITPLRGQRLTWLVVNLNRLILLKKKEATVVLTNDLILTNSLSRPSLLVSRAKLQRAIFWEDMGIRLKSLQERWWATVMEATSSFRKWWSKHLHRAMTICNMTWQTSFPTPKPWS